MGSKEGIIFSGVQVTFRARAKVIVRFIKYALLGIFNEEGDFLCFVFLIVRDQVEHCVWAPPADTNSPQGNPFIVIENAVRSCID